MSSEERIRLEEVAHLANIVRRAYEHCRAKERQSMTPRNELFWGAQATVYNELHQWLTTGQPPDGVLTWVNEDIQAEIKKATD